MKVILLSGGSGKRLWPLSNDSRSKQFLKILADDKGNMQSMSQRVWMQLERAKLTSSTIIATSKSQVEMIQQQVQSDVPLVVEPERRDTFPAIALAATYLYSVQGIGLDEVVAVLPVDPYVEDEFFNTIKDLEKTINLTGADLALIGATPTHPSEKYGYIVPEDEINHDYINVKQFVEKPNEQIAQNIIDSNGLWNCGVFAFKLNFIISYLQNSGFPIHYNELLNQYHSLPKTSFDYEIVEKTKEIVALPHQGYWKDLGTWNTLTEEMLTQQIGPGKACDFSINTHIINELNIPIAVLGIKNAVIAASPDGILVSDKKASPRIKSLLSDFIETPRYEEHLWGWWKELDRSYTSSEHIVFTKKVFIKGGKHLNYQIHSNSDMSWTILNGNGQLVVDGELKVIHSGDVLKVSAGIPYALKAITDLEMIEVQKNITFSSEEPTRLLENWEEIAELSHSLRKV